MQYRKGSPQMQTDFLFQDNIFVGSILDLEVALKLHQASVYKWPMNLTSLAEVFEVMKYILPVFSDLLGCRSCRKLIVPHK
jgi:hypothetical protein